ncbi:hypothetical protein [Dyadobacter sp.]|uniref:hypothetical protein n=1 Tax=Dyadobacter sp. TaxID=1914288 RepID=UPI003F70BCB8
MDVKTKIALNTIAKQLSRGIISEEKAEAEVLKLIGPDPAKAVAEDPELGKYLDVLEERYPMPEKKDPETEAAPGPTVELPEPSPKRTRKPAAAKAKGQ